MRNTWSKAWTRGFAVAMLMGSVGSVAPVVIARDAAARETRETGVIGVDEARLSADYWIARARDADRTVLDPAAIAAQNERLRKTDPSLHAIESLPVEIAAEDVLARVRAISAWPDGELFDEQGAALGDDAKQQAVYELGLDRVPPAQPLRYALVVKRAPLRAFPTSRRVFRSKDDHDIDRLQENALFPGTPVAVLLASRDAQWYFVVSPLYQAWIPRDAIAFGGKDDVLGYATRTPFLVVTGSVVRTTFTPDEPRVSELALDMGVRVPVRADWPADQPVNGQHPYTAHVIDLPVRDADGSLAFAPALLPKSADVSGDYLALNRANVLRQGFKFLGERYGWGHDYGTRDCSGFVSEVYRSFGVTLPRNTRDQAVTPALDRIEVPADLPHAKRMALLKTLDVGDLVYIPGHVMMVIGHEDGVPYVIHDTTGITYRDARGKTVRAKLNGVSVTPLVPLLLSDDKPFVDGITNIQRIRPRGVQ